MPQRTVDYLASAAVKFVGSAPSSVVEVAGRWLFDAMAVAAQAVDRKRAA